MTEEIKVTEIQLSTSTYLCGCVSEVESMKFCKIHQGISDTDRRKLELWDEMVERLNWLNQWAERAEAHLDGRLVTEESQFRTAQGLRLENKFAKEILAKAAKLEGKP